jgi:glycosyltransferase involved in cell wall biosynthesis
MRRVLHIQKVKGVSGSENHLLTLLPALRGCGIEPFMLALADAEDRPEEFVAGMRSLGVPVEVLCMQGDVDPLLVPAIVRRIRRIAPDLVHTHLFHADLYGALASGLAGTPCISTKHGWNPWRARALFGALDRMAAIRQRRIIVISRAIGRWLEKVEGLPAAKMRVVHYALDAERFRAMGGRDAGGDATAAPSPAPSRPVVGCVTRLMEQKGVHVLIEAFSACLKVHPTASLLIAGDGPGRPRLERLARALGIGERVRFLGNVPHAHLGRIYTSMDIFAFPSFGEGFGLALLEAMAWGKPVAASRVMAIPEIVRDGETGLLTPPNDPAALARALLRLLGDDALRLRMGEVGRRRVEETFTVERMARETARVYEESLAEGPC